MGLQDEMAAGLQVKRGPGRPRANGGSSDRPSVVATPSRPAPKYDPDQMYWATKHDYEGGHQGPVPLTVVTEHGAQRAVLIPEQRVKVSGTLLNESLGHAVIDERGPDLEKNLESLANGQETISQFDSEGKVTTRSRRMTGKVRARFNVEVEGR